MYNCFDLIGRFSSRFVITKKALAGFFCLVYTARMQAPGASAHIESPIPTWFFEKPDGKIIAVQEQEAWRIYTGKNQIIGQRNYPPKIIGVGNGQIYRKAVADAIELKTKGDMEGSQACLRQGYEDELTEARNHIRKPRNFDMIGRNQQPTTINELQGGI